MPHIATKDCWLCERHLYRGRFGLITRRRETSEGWRDFHTICAKRFDEEGEAAAREIVRLEQSERWSRPSS